MYFSNNFNKPSKEEILSVKWIVENNPDDLDSRELWVLENQNDSSEDFDEEVIE